MKNADQKSDIQCFLTSKRTSSSPLSCGISIFFTFSFKRSILIGIFIRKKQPSTIIHKKVQNLNSFNQNNKSRNENLFEIIKKCIKSTFVTLSMILGFMIIFISVLISETKLSFLHRGGKQ